MYPLLHSLLYLHLYRYVWSIGTRPHECMDACKIVVFENVCISTYYHPYVYTISLSASMYICKYMCVCRLMWVTNFYPYFMSLASRFPRRYT